MKSLPVVPVMTTLSLASPSAVAISMSESDADPSEVNPGASRPPLWSITICSAVPAWPVIEIVSVFVVVAPPQATGENPNQISPPTTLTVAAEPGVMLAVTACVDGS